MASSLVMSSQCFVDPNIHRRFTFPDVLNHAYYTFQLKNYKFTSAVDTVVNFVFLFCGVAHELVRVA